MIEHGCCRATGFRRGVGIAALVVLAAAVLGAVVMALWNCLMPAIFGLRTIHFWQALGLLLLAKLLFGGFHRHGHGFHRRQRMLQRWEGMTPEEREKFRHGLHARFCCHGADKD